jgi:hypothetical protein
MNYNKILKCYSNEFLNLFCKFGDRHMVTFVLSLPKESKRMDTILTTAKE